MAQRQQQKQHLLRLFDSSFKASFNALQSMRVYACVGVSVGVCVPVLQQRVKAEIK